MSGQIVRQEYELTCIAPVHVGSGEVLRPFEYLYDRDKLKAYFLHGAKWFSFLEDRDLSDAFVQYLETEATGRKSRNLLEWLKVNHVTLSDLRQANVIRREIPVAKLSDQRAKKPTLNNVTCQLVRSDNAHPYIPGSTIKGALRTGILYHFIRKDPGRFDSYWQEISSVRGSDKASAWNDIILRLEQEILHTLTYDGAKKRDAVVSALRGLSVSDAALVGCKASASTVIVQKIDATTLIKRGAARGESAISLFRECIPAGSRLRFAVTADLAMLETAGIMSIDQVMESLRDYTSDGLRLQKQVFLPMNPRFYQPLFEKAETADMLLGGGTGFLSKTLIYALAGAEAEARRFAAAYFDEQFTNPSHKHRAIDKVLTPRTLKRAQTDGADWIMGLCSIRGIGDAQTI